MKKIYFFQFFVVCLFYSCSISEKDIAINVASFPKISILVGDAGHEMLGIPIDIGLKDSILVMNSIVEPFIRFYDTINFREIGNFGRKGKGPNEFIYLRFYDDFSKNKTDAWFFDPNGRKLLKYNVQELISLPALLKPIKVIFMPYLSAIETCIVNISDSLIIGGSYSKNGQQFFYNPINQSIMWTTYFPKIKYEGESEELGQLYYGIVRKKPDCTKVVCALRFFKRIIITDVRSNASITLKTNQPEQYFPKSNIDLNYLQGLRFMYLDLCCCEKFIFALYADVTSKQLDDYGFSKSRIQVFDYSGKPIAEMTIDQQINSISVDEENGLIFGSNRANGMIYKFKIPENFFAL